MEYLDINGLRIRDCRADWHILADVARDMYKIPANPKTAVDIGAHIGIFSVATARAGALVYAYEPEAVNYQILCHNTMDYNVRTFNLGVGTPGERKLYVHPENTGGTSLFLNKYLNADKYQMVKVISIKEVFKNIPHCDLLKMDCEGAEDEIIEDFDDELASKIEQISMEYHHHYETMDKLKKWYKEVGHYHHLLIFKK